MLHLLEIITVSSETTVDGSDDHVINDGEVIQNSNTVVEQS